MVSAIANQTQILRDCIQKVKTGDLVGGEDLQCSYALKWAVHFLGDIAQPLHASGIAAGGNGIEVVFANQTTELHAVSLTLNFVPLSSFFLRLNAYRECRSGMAGLSTPMQTSLASQTQPFSLSSSISSPASKKTIFQFLLPSG